MLFQTAIYSVAYPNPTHIYIAKGDVGASSHQFRPEDALLLNDLQRNNTVNVKISDGKAIVSFYQDQPPFPNMLSKQSKTVTIPPHLRNVSLFSLGQLCDNNCDVHLDKKNLTVKKTTKQF